MNHQEEVFAIILYLPIHTIQISVPIISSRIPTRIVPTCHHIHVISESNGVNKVSCELDSCISFSTEVWRFSSFNSETPSLLLLKFSKIVMMSLNDGRSAGSCFQHKRIKSFSCFCMLTSIFWSSEAAGGAVRVGRKPRSTCWNIYATDDALLHGIFPAISSYTTQAKE